ncbi:MAG: hypothetical protein IJH39_04545 [Clostridia bacterium]|nr:hypothetical protein [Clostridia bacterium]
MDIKKKLYWFWYKLKYHFSEEYRIFHHPIYINLKFHRLWIDWWKCRKVFIKPKLRLYKGDSAEREFTYYMYDWQEDFANKFFGFHIARLGWKYKWGYYVYTHSPEIVCVFRGKVLFTLRMEYPLDNIKPELQSTADRLYWEAIVSYLYDYKKDIIKTYKNCYLTDIDPDTNKTRYYHIDQCLIPAIKDKVIILKPQTED